MRNFLLLTSSNMGASTISLLINIYLARTVSIEVFGQYGLFIAWSNILLVLSSLGLQQIVIRYIARNQENSTYYFKFGLFARLLGYLLMVLGYFFYVKIFGGYNLNLGLLLLVQVFLLSFWDGTQNLAFGMQRMEFTGYISLTCNLLLLLIFVFTPKNLLSIEVLVLGLAITQLIKDMIYVLVCSKLNLFRYKKNHFNVSGGFLQLLIKESFPYYILLVFSLFTIQFPILFLEINSNLNEVAYFNASNKLTVPIVLIFGTAMTALFPNLAQLFKNDIKKFSQYIRNALTFLVIGGSIFCFIISLFRKEIITLIYGEDFITASIVLATQTWFVLFSAIFSLFGNVFGASDNEKMLAKLSLFYALVNAPILWFASSYGAKYLSYGYIVGAVINMTYHFKFFQKCLPEKIPIKLIIKSIVFLLICIVISILIPESIAIIYKLIVLILVTFSSVMYFIYKKIIY